jgi:hypothetical protein
MEVVRWISRLVSGLSPRRPGFDTRPVRVSFVVVWVALGQVFLLLLRFPPVNSLYTFVSYRHTVKNLTLMNDIVIEWFLYLPCVLYFSARLLVNWHLFSPKLILSYEFIFYVLPDLSGRGSVSSVPLVCLWQARKSDLATGVVAHRALTLRLLVYKGPSVRGA